MDLPSFYTIPLWEFIVYMGTWLLQTWKVCTKECLYLKDRLFATWESRMKMVAGPRICISNSSEICKDFTGITPEFVPNET
jgi:hypothetical protein